MKKKFLKAVKKGHEGQVTRLLNAQPLHSTLLEKATSEGKRLLAVAAEHGQLGVVRLLVQRGANLSATDREDKTALHLAATMGHEEVVRFLLSQEGQAVPPVSTKSIAGTPLMLASENGHIGVVQVLVQHREAQGSDAGLDERGKDGWTAMHWAATMGHEEVVSFLLSRDTQAVTVTTKSSARTPLMLASGNGHLGVVRMLVRHKEAQGLDAGGLDERDKDGWTAIHWAAQDGHAEVVRFLLSKGARDNNTPDSTMKLTPLQLACEWGYVGVVQVLVQHWGERALLELGKGEEGALHWALVNGHEELVAFLLRTGMKLSKMSTSVAKRTPLMAACMRDHVGVAEVIVQHMGRQVLEETDEQGRTALHRVAMFGRPKVAAFLLSQGAQATRTSTFHQTPLMLACLWGNLGVVRAFIKHRGAHGLHDTDDYGMTALHWAAHNGYYKSTKRLLLAGADPNRMDSGGNTARAHAQASGLKRSKRCVAVFEVRQCQMCTAWAAIACRHCVSITVT
jgi:ankyrin repeat protein